MTLLSPNYNYRPVWNEKANRWESVITKKRWWHRLKEWRAPRIKVPEWIQVYWYYWRMHPYHRFMNKRFQVKETGPIERFWDEFTARYHLKKPLPPLWADPYPYPLRPKLPATSDIGRDWDILEEPEVPATPEERECATATWPAQANRRAKRYWSWKTRLMYYSRFRDQAIPENPLELPTGKLTEFAYKREVNRLHSAHLWKICLSCHQAYRKPLWRCPFCHSWKYTMKNQAEYISTERHALILGILKADFNNPATWDGIYVEMVDGIRSIVSPWWLRRQPYFRGFDLDHPIFRKGLDTFAATIHNYYIGPRYARNPRLSPQYIFSHNQYGDSYEEIARYEETDIPPVIAR